MSAKIHRNPNKFLKKTVEYGGGNILACGCSIYDIGCPIHRVECNMDRFVYKDLLEKASAEERMTLVWKFHQENDQKPSSKYKK